MDDDDCPLALMFNSYSLTSYDLMVLYESHYYYYYYYTKYSFILILIISVL